MLPAKALKSFGLVDEIHESEAENEASAIDFLAGLLQEVPDEGRQLAKAESRHTLTDAWSDQAFIREEARLKWPVLCSESVVKGLGATLARLQKKPAKI